MQRGREQGLDLRTVAQHLGIDHNTLRAWRKDSERSPGPTPARRRARQTTLQPVVVGDGKIPRRFVVTTPHGHRCECQSIDDAAALLRALGC
jgi:hypothetical protein